MMEEKEELRELSHGFMIAALANSLLSVAIGRIPDPVPAEHRSTALGCISEYLVDG